MACKLGSWGLLHLRTLLPCPSSAAPTSLLLACTLQTSSTQRSTSVASCWGWRVRSPTRQFHTSRAARQQHAAPRCVGSLQRGAVSLSFHLPLAAHPPQAVSDTTCHCWSLCMAAGAGVASQLTAAAAAYGAHGRRLQQRRRAAAADGRQRICGAHVRHAVAAQGGQRSKLVSPKLVIGDAAAVLTFFLCTLQCCCMCMLLPPTVFKPTPSFDPELLACVAGARGLPLAFLLHLRPFLHI